MGYRFRARRLHIASSSGRFDLLAVLIGSIVMLACSLFNANAFFDPVTYSLSMGGGDGVLCSGRQLGQRCGNPGPNHGAQGRATITVDSSLLDQHVHLSAPSAVGLFNLSWDFLL